jgi:hypothetical protein
MKAVRYEVSGDFTGADVPMPAAGPLAVRSSPPGLLGAQLIGGGGASVTVADKISSC